MKSPPIENDSQGIHGTHSREDAVRVEEFC